jgi:hypothetical protein
VAEGSNQSRSASSRRSTCTSHSRDETNETEDRQSAPAQLDRAGEVVDRLSKRIGEWANVATMQVVVAYARVREEAEDIWAEAQSIRRRTRS